jgi:cell division inhibitor SepF
MSNFLEKFRNILGLNEELDDDNDTAVNINANSNDISNVENTESLQEENSYKRKKQSRSNIIDISPATVSEMIIVEPESYDDAPKVVNLLRSKIGVVLTFVNTKLSETEKLHIIDFICGAVYAIDGNQKTITKDVYMFTPGNMSINFLKKSHNEELNFDKNIDKLFLTVDEINTKKSRVS